MYLVFTRMPGESYCGCTCGAVYVPCIYTHARWELLWMYFSWSLCTLYLHACQVRVTVNVLLMEFMYLVFTRMAGESYCECTSDGVYVPCIYTHARWELLWMYFWWSLCTLYLHACQVRVTVGDSVRSLLLCLCDVFRMLINSLICWFCTSALGLVLFQIYMLVSYSNLPTG